MGRLGCPFRKIAEGLPAPSKSDRPQFTVVRFADQAPSCCVYKRIYIDLARRLRFSPRRGGSMRWIANVEFCPASAGAHRKGNNAAHSGYGSTSPITGAPASARSSAAAATRPDHVKTRALWHVAFLLLATNVAAGQPAAAACGDNGGPGYRNQSGKCVGWESLARQCGSPPTSKCAPERVAEGAGEAANKGAAILSLRDRSHERRTQPSN